MHCKFTTWVSYYNWDKEYTICLRYLEAIASRNPNTNSNSCNIAIDITVIS